MCLGCACEHVHLKAAEKDTNSDTDVVAFSRPKPNLCPFPHPFLRHHISSHQILASYPLLFLFLHPAPQSPILLAAVLVSEESEKEVAAAVGPVERRLLQLPESHEKEHNELERGHNWTQVQAGPASIMLFLD